MRPLRLPATHAFALSFIWDVPRKRLFDLLRWDETSTGPEARQFELFERELGARKVEELEVEEMLAHIGYQGDIRSKIAEANERCARVVDEASSQGICAIGCGDERYPELLARIYDPPLVLWVRGSIQSLSGNLVAVVGSRAASPYGEQAAWRIASELAGLGVTVASGLARGIDAAAHRGCLEGGGQTVAVVASGVDIIYPPEHGKLMEEIARQGAVISEYEPGTVPIPYRFPERNRIISGLSRGVVVVEAWQHSGALITANCALEQNRDVMAVPGNVLSARHRGSHSLLKCGAALVESGDDVMRVLNPGGGAVAALSSNGLAGHPGSTEADDPILRAIDVIESADLDQLVAVVNKEPAELLARLLELELKGLVRRVPGGRFVRSQGTC